jgi:hypothetical protein
MRGTAYHIPAARLQKLWFIHLSGESERKTLKRKIAVFQGFAHSQQVCQPIVMSK